MKFSPKKLQKMLNDNELNLTFIYCFSHTMWLGCEKGPRTVFYDIKYNNKIMSFSVAYYPSSYVIDGYHLPFVPIYGTEKYSEQNNINKFIERVMTEYFLELKSMNKRDDTE